MMKKYCGFLAAAFSVFLIISCGLSKEEIAETVKTSMQETFDSDHQFREYGLKVVDVSVLGLSDRSYKGYVKVLHDGSTHNVTVDVLVDGESVAWEAPQGAFMFIAQKEFQKNLRELQNSFGY